MPGLAPAPADVLDLGTQFRSQAIASPSPDARASVLLSGYKWGTSTISFSFFAGGRYYGTETNPAPVSDAVKANVRYILNDIIAPVINVTFNEVADTPTSYGLIRILRASNPSYSYAYFPTGADFNRGDSRDQSGDVVLGTTWDVEGSNSNNFRNGPGSHGFMSLVHELGHALGLKHPGNYGGSGPFLSLGDDNGDNSLMTYNFFSGENQSTPMAYDLLALQHLYGAKTSTRSGDTTYTFTAVDSFSPGSGGTGTPVPIYDTTKHTIWDGGGTDTIDVSALAAEASGYRIDIRPGGWITRTVGFNARGYNATTGSTTTFTSGSAYVATDYGTRMALSGAVLENVVVSRSDDTIFLNDAANRVSGYAPGVAAGNDVIHGSGQLDTLDLSLFRQQDVGTTQRGSDLVLDLGATGTVTIKDYFAVPPSQRMVVSYQQAAPDAIVTVGGGDVLNDTTIRTGTVQIVKRGLGTLVLDLANSHSGGTRIEAGEVIVRNASALGTGIVVVGPGARLTLDVGVDAVSLAGFDIQGTGRLDVGAGRVVLGAGTFDLAMVRGYLAAGHAAGTWSGSFGITSAVAAATPGRAVGHAFDGDGNLVVGFAAFGDLNLDGVVDFDDVIAFVSAGFFDSGQPAAWDTGDFDYNGIVDFDDVLAMAAAGLYDQRAYLPR